MQTVLRLSRRGRCRHWGISEKLRIVDESLVGQRGASATTRRHDIPYSFLFKWRKAYREGRLGGIAMPAFVSARVVATGVAAAGPPPTRSPYGRPLAMELTAGRGGS